MKPLDIPSRMARLPVDRGYQVPWFVTWWRDGKQTPIGIGKPDFRIFSEDRLIRALRDKRCILCGDKLGRYMTFVTGPMCTVSRVTAEPPCHHDCASFAVRRCPFMVNPRVGRSDRDMPGNLKEPGGEFIMRNPGASCMWTTLSYQVHRDATKGDGIFMTMGEPQRVEWFAHGRPATRAEVDASIESGLPELRRVAALQGVPEDAISEQLEVLRRYLP